MHSKYRPRRSSSLNRKRPRNPSSNSPPSHRETHSNSSSSHNSLNNTHLNSSSNSSINIVRIMCTNSSCRAATKKGHTVTGARGTSMFVDAQTLIARLTSGAARFVTLASHQAQFKKVPRQMGAPISFVKSTRTR